MDYVEDQQRPLASLPASSSPLDRENARLKAEVGRLVPTIAAELQRLEELAQQRKEDLEQLRAEMDALQAARGTEAAHVAAERVAAERVAAEQANFLSLLAAECEKHLESSLQPPLEKGWAPVIGRNGDIVQQTKPFSPVGKGVMGSSCHIKSDTIFKSYFCSQQCSIHDDNLPLNQFFRVGKTGFSNFLPAQLQQAKALPIVGIVCS